MITAEQIAIDIIARMDKAEGDIKRFDTTFTNTKSSLDRSAKALEAIFDRLSQSSAGSFRKAAASTGQAANDIEKNSARAANASRNLGRQVADVGTQLAGGQSPFLILAQQAPQVADALADTGGKAAKLALFFAGPWGAALLAAGSILGTFIPQLIHAGDATDQMTAAQKDLSTYVDKATGAINQQTSAIQRLAAAQARQSDVEAATAKHAAARGNAINAVRSAAGVTDQTPVFTAGGVTVSNAANITDPIKQKLRDLAAEAARTGRSMNDFALDVRKAVGDRPEYQSLVRTVTSQAAAAVTAAKDVGKLQAEQAVLTGTATAAQKALLGLGGSMTSLIEKEVALATATTATEKARAKLALVQEHGKDIVAGDAKAQAQYRTDLTAASNAVNKAEAAEKAAAAAKRDHAAATRAQTKDLREAAQAAKELGALQGDLLSVKSGLTSDSRLQDEYQRQRIGLDRDTQLGGVDARVDQGALSPALAAEQKKLISAIADGRLQQVNWNEAIRTAGEDLDAAQAKIGNQSGLLQAQEGLAKTAGERRAIELKLFDLQVEEARVRAQNIVDLAAQGKATPQAGKIAKGTLDALPALTELGHKRISQDNASPLAAYADQVNRTSAQLREDAEGIAVSGLEAFNDHLGDSITKALHLHGIFGDIIADLAKMAIKQAILGPLVNSISGGTGGFFGKILSGLSGARATGGPVSAGGAYLVGERGPELLQMGGAGGNIVPNSSFAAMGNIRAAQPAQQRSVVEHRVVVEPSPLFVTTVQSEVQSGTIGIVAQLAPSIVQASKTATLTAAGRPGLPRSAG